MNGVTQKLIIIALCSATACAGCFLAKAMRDVACWVKNRNSRWNSIKGLEEKNHRLGEELIEARAQIGVLRVELNRASVAGGWVDNCQIDAMAKHIEQLTNELNIAKKTIQNLNKQIERRNAK